MNIFYHKKWVMLLHIPLLIVVLLSAACADVVSEAVREAASSVEKLAAVVLNQVDPQLRDGALLLDWEDPNDNDFSEIEIIATPKGGGKTVVTRLPRGYNINRKDPTIPEGYRYRLGGLESGKKYKIEIVAYGKNNKKSESVKSEYVEIDEDKTAPDDDIPIEELQIVPVEGVTDKMKAVWDPEEIDFDIARIKMIVYKADGSAEILEEVDIEDINTGEQEFTKPTVKFKVGFLLEDHDGNMQEVSRLDDVKNNFEIDPNMEVNLITVAGLKTTAAEGKVTIGWSSPQILSASTERIIVKIFDLTHENELAVIIVDAHTIGTNYGVDIAANGKSVSIDNALIGKSKFKVSAQVQKNGMLFDVEESGEDEIEDDSYEDPPEVIGLGARAYKTRILVYWKEPREEKEQAGEFEEYTDLAYWGVEIILKNGNTEVERKLVAKGEESVLFEGLSPATIYTIEAISLGLTSTKQPFPIFKSVTTLAQDAQEPTTLDPVKEVELEGYYSDGDKLFIKLSWENPENPDLSGILLTVKKNGSPILEWNEVEIENYKHEKYYVFDLNPDTYDFELIAVYGTKKSAVVRKTYTSSERPLVGSVKYLIESVVASTGKQEIIVTFAKPVYSGDGEFFIVVVYDKASGAWVAERYLEFGKKTVVINNAYDKYLTLEPGKQYIVNLVKHDERGMESEEKQIGVVTIDADAEKVVKIGESGTGIGIGQAAPPEAATSLAATTTDTTATVTFNSPSNWGLDIEGQALSKDDITAVAIASSLVTSSSDGRDYVFELLRADFAASFGTSEDDFSDPDESPFISNVVVGKLDTLASSGMANTITLTGLDSNCKYNYLVILLHPTKGVEPAVSQIKTFITQDTSTDQARPPGAVTALVAKPKKNGNEVYVDITFNSPSDWGSDAEGTALTSNDVQAAIVAAKARDYPFAEGDTEDAYFSKLLNLGAETSSDSAEASSGFSLQNVPLKPGVRLEAIQNIAASGENSVRFPSAKDLDNYTRYHYLVVLIPTVENVDISLSMGTFATHPLHADMPTQISATPDSNSADIAFTSPHHWGTSRVDGSPLSAADVKVAIIAAKNSDYSADGLDSEAYFNKLLGSNGEINFDDVTLSSFASGVVSMGIDSSQLQDSTGSVIVTFPPTNDLSENTLYNYVVAIFVLASDPSTTGSTLATTISNVESFTTTSAGTGTGGATPPGVATGVSATQTATAVDVQFTTPQDLGTDSNGDAHSASDIVATVIVSPRQYTSDTTKEEYYGGMFDVTKIQPDIQQSLQDTLVDGTFGVAHPGVAASGSTNLITVPTDALEAETTYYYMVALAVPGTSGGSESVASISDIKHFTTESTGTGQATPPGEATGVFAVQQMAGEPAIVEFYTPQSFGTNSEGNNRPATDIVARVIVSPRQYTSGTSKEDYYRGMFDATKEQSGQQQSLQDILVDGTFGKELPGEHLATRTSGESITLAVPAIGEGTLEAGTTYYYMVVLEVKNSALSDGTPLHSISDIRHFTTAGTSAEQATPPGAATGLSATQTATAVDVQFTTPQDWVQIVMAMLILQLI